jgi:hypothetical protein
MVALPLLYVLSVPPVYLMFVRASFSPGSGVVKVPTWIEVYSGPFNWLSDVPLLSEIMRVYFLWWVELLNVPGVW